MIANYHTHTTYSDGHAGCEAYIEKAKARNLQAIGFSDHAPLPFSNNFTMATDRLDSYFAELEQLAGRHEGALAIWKSLEVDYIPGVIYPGHSNFAHFDLDYVIGAVHYVDFYPDGKPWNVDGSIKGFQKGLNELFHGDIREAVMLYYGLQYELITEYKPDILAHMDRIKRHNFEQEFFDTREGWYRNAVATVLDAMAANGTILEVNTKGFYNNGEPEFYPSRDILEMALERNIRVHPASDAHRPEHIDSAFHRVLELLADIGFKHVAHYNGTNWEPVSIGLNVSEPAA